MCARILSTSKYTQFWLSQPRDTLVSEGRWSPEPFRLAPRLSTVSAVAELPDMPSESAPAARRLFGIATVLLAAAVLLQPLCAFAAEPVKHIRIYVQPYYEAGRTADERPQVAVGESLSGM